MKRYIKIGQIVKCSHLDDEGEITVHPFLIVNITKNNIYAVQCSSVKTEDNESYFSRNGIPYFEFLFSSLEYSTHIRLDKISKFLNDEIKDVWSLSGYYDF